MKFNLGQDLLNNDTVRQSVQTDKTFAQELYSALCNTQFIHSNMANPKTEFWSCSWRYAGNIVAGIEANGGDYMDYYCNGNEGQISPRIKTILASLGWSSQPWPDSFNDTVI